MNITAERMIEADAASRSGGPRAALREAVGNAAEATRSLHAAEARRDQSQRAVWGRKNDLRKLERSLQPDPGSEARPYEADPPVLPGQVAAEIRSKIEAAKVDVQR